MAAADYRDLIARAYYRVAAAGANMLEATSSLERIREALEATQGYHETLETFEQQIGEVENEQLMAALCELRTAYVRPAIRQETERLRREFARKPDAGWRAWANAYVRIFQETAWRTDEGNALTRDGLMSSPVSQWPVERIKRATSLIARGHWAEAYDFLLFLVDQPVPDAYRARLLAIAAEIQIYRFMRPGRAEQLLRRADEVGAGEHLPARVWAELAQTRKQYDDAKARYREMTEEKPDLADGYMGLAEVADLEGDAAGAESYYQQAIAAAPGMSAAHRNLMNWHGRRIDEKESLVMPLFRRVLALSDDDPADYIGLGLLYHQNKKYEQAREWLRKALVRDPDRALAEVWLGYVDCDEAAADESRAAALLASAEEHFHRTIALAPEDLGGYWGLAGLFMQRKEWQTALEWCERGIECHAEWEPFILVRLAQVRRELDDIAGAEQDIMRSLELEPENPAALDELSTLIDRVQRVDNARGEALLAEWRRLKGDSVEYLYQNRLGNWRYGEGAYPESLEHYRKAVAARKDDPVLWANLAGAAEKLRSKDQRVARLNEAIAALTEAARISPDRKDYLSRLQRLSLERDFVEAYGERALDLKPVIVPIRVDIPKENLPAILDSTQSDLSKNTMETIEAWRRDFRGRLGMPLPGIRFFELTDAQTPPKFRITLFGEESHWVDSRTSEILGRVLRQVELLSTPHLARFLGHQETANLLRDLKDPQATAIVDTPSDLTRFVAVLRSLLERRISITDLRRIVAEFSQQRETGAPAEEIAAAIAGMLPVQGD
jgi:tetratricopeptide (TPR) repeat protein